MPKQKQERDNRYYKALFEESICDLGESVHLFRNIQLLNLKSLDINVSKDVLSLIDLVYQESFDKIIDALTNMNELNGGEFAIKALEKSLQVKRGLVKLDTLIKE